MTNHLGNVLSVISDKRIGVSSGGSIIDYYRAEVLSQSDYYPLGMEEPYRQYRLHNYRFGFNGQEKDNEINGKRYSLTAPFWQYDPRAGLRWNLDPKPSPYLSPYVVFKNDPILFGDPLGDTTKIYGTAEVTGTTLSDKGGTSDVAGLAFTYKETSFVPAVDKDNKLIGYNIWDLKNQTLKHPIMQIEPGDVPDFVKHYNGYLMGARLYYANGEPSEGVKKMAAGIAGNPGLYWAGLRQEWNNALHDPVFVATLLLSMAHASVRIAEPTIPVVDVAKGGIQLSRRTLGHTFSTHGDDMTDFLLNRARGSGMAQGQFLDNQKAARVILDNLGKTANGAINIPIPRGFPARVIMPDGTFKPATHIRLVPGGNGVKAAYPLIP